MAEDATYERDFSPAFLRKIIALGVRTGLHRRVQGSLLPAHFAGSSDGSKKSPRQRLAELVERHAEQDPKGWPGLETMDMLVDKAAAVMRPEEADLLRAEWTEIRNVPVTDAQYVEAEVAQWVDRLGVQRAILAAADLYQSGATATEVRAQLIRDLNQAAPTSDGTRVSLLETWRERLIAWEQGDDLASRVPTGLRRLDLALGGGPRRGESYFFLAPPKGAKTAAQMNVTLNAARRQFGAALFSFEMSSRPTTMRMDRNISASTKADLRADTTPLKKAYEGWIAAGAGDVIVYTDLPMSQSNCDMIERRVEEDRRMGKVIDVVCADFLNIMSPSGGAARGERDDLTLARVAREMHQAAKNLGVVWWSAALVKREAIAKPKLQKNDIARVFEAIAIAHGIIGICAPEELVMQNMRNLYLTALRDDEDGKSAGLVELDLDRMIFRDASLEAQTRAEQTPEK